MDRNRWIWVVVGVLVVGGLIYWFTQNDNGSTTSTTAGVTTTTGETATTAATTTTAEPTETTGATETTAGAEVPDLAGRSVTVALENLYTPFNFYPEEGGDPIGWDYDALAEICSRLNCVPDFQEVAWDGLILAVSNGQYDVGADGITITDDRKEVVDFSDGYITVEQRLMKKLGDTRFSTLEEVKAGDYIIGTQIGTTNFETAVGEYGQERLQGFDTFPAAVLSLIAGDVDVVIIDDTAGAGYVGANADQIELLPGAIVSDELGFIFQQGSDLVAAFNSALASMTSDGKLEEINGKWFGA
jgi:polar amino acid transport system substrate-binding protein